MSRVGGRAAPAASVIAILALVLGGCAGTPTTLSDGAVSRLQTAVLAVSRASADGDLLAARAALDAVSEEVRSDRERDEISVARLREIEALVVLVAADLATLEQEAAQAAELAAARAAAESGSLDQQAEPTAEATDRPATPGNKGHGKKK